MSKLVFAMVLSLMSVTAAQADGWWGAHDHKPLIDRTPTITRAPEVDPASAVTGLILMAGVLAVARGRRNKK